MKVVIMAGGMGTRIASVAGDIPKPMIPVMGKPVLEHEIENLRDQGYADILLVIGHLGKIIRDYFGDGRSFGVKISYFEESTPLGTAGAFYYLKESLKEDFFLLNADAVMDIDFHRMEKFHRTHGGLATVFTHPGSHPQDSTLVVTDADDVVTAWIGKDEKRPLLRNRVNAGVHILSPAAVECVSEARKWDLDREILKPLVGKRAVYAYHSTEYVKDMGTPERLEEVRREFAAGIPAKRNLRISQKAIFLDRDGTLNRYCGYVTRPDRIELLPGVGEALRILNGSEYLAIVVTNQPVIARGECTFRELDAIHAALEMKLAERGAYVDDIFFCPHHPDGGYPGELARYKVECTCRKPKPGMLFAAAGKYNIDLSASYMVGDSLNDIRAGAAAGCTPVYIGRENLKEGGEGGISFVKRKSLLDFVTGRINNMGRADDHNTDPV